MTSSESAMLTQPAFCSGFGLNHSEKYKPLVTITWDEITQLVDHPQDIAKERGQWVMPSTLVTRQGKAQEKGGEYWMLWADIDEEPRPVAKTAKFMNTLLDGCQFEVYTTKRATRSIPKTRVLIPLDESLSPKEWKDCQWALNDELAANYVAPDLCSQTFSQLALLPNRGKFYESESNRTGAYFKPLKVFSLAITTKNEAANERNIEPTPALNFNASILASNDPTPYGMQALENECQAIAGAPQGARNDQFNKSCFNIGQLVAGGAIESNLALNSLTQAAQKSGLPTEEIAKTLASGFKAGKDNPRTGPEAQGSVSQGVAESLTWDKPKELKAELLPVKPLYPEMLPDSMRDYITDIAERMDHSSPDYVAVGVMVALATLIGRKLAVMPKRFDPWLVVPNLWGAVIGRPSAKKTPSLTKAMAPLHQFESVEFEKHGLAMSKYLEKEKVAKVALKANEKLLKKKIEGGKQEEGEKDFLKSLNLGPVEPPPCKRFIVNDATVEKLGELLGSNPMGVLLFRDELTGWLNMLDKPDRASDRAFYLECWAGTGSFTYDRIGRGTQRIESATLSLMGGIQPGKLMPYLVAQKEGKGDDGLIERFQLMVFPDPKPFEHVDRRPNEEAEQKAIQIFNKLNWLEGDLANPTILKFLPDAQKLFDTWYDKNQNLVRSATLSPQLESHLAKYVSLFPSLALVIHAVDSSPGGSIGIQSAKKALAWCEYLESHARRVYALADGPIGSAKALQKRLHNMPNPFRIGAINSKNWHGLTTTDQIHEALNSLCEHGHLQKVVSSTTRPATDYFKHPSYCNR